MLKEANLLVKDKNINEDNNKIRINFPFKKVDLAGRIIQSNFKEIKFLGKNHFY